ncbi:hypothetical protein TSL1_16300 [Sulfurovum sp. TSL1]|nr:hypothetical protein TSL1_16300 [Sulfurovum sp. TSL1]
MSTTATLIILASIVLIGYRMAWYLEQKVQKKD